MKSVWIALVIVVCLHAEALAGERGPVYPFSFKYFNESVDGQFGLSFFTEHVRSPYRYTIYELGNNAAHPIPVYMRSYGLMTMNYEPRFRLLEFGSSASLNLCLPLTGSISTVNFVSREGRAPEITGDYTYQVDGGTNDEFHLGPLGYGTLMGGGLLGFRAGAGATKENLSSVGFDIAGGVQYVIAPLFANLEEFTNLRDYNPYRGWGQVIGRAGICFQSVAFYYTLGLNANKVFYQQNDVDFQYNSSVWVNTYHRFHIAFELGK